MTFGDPPLKLAIYDQVVDASSVDYWNGPRTLDPGTLEYVRGEKRFRNPSNYGLSTLPIGLPKWRNRSLRFDESCNQAAELTPAQNNAIRLIVEQADEIPNGGKTWRYNFALNFEKMVYQPGFNSAFAQAINIAALLFAECKTKDPAYLDLIRSAGLTLITPISDGGVMNTADGMTFFEEMPAAPGMSPYILNAHLLSINVLFALSKRTGDKRFEEAARRGIETFIKLEPQYTAPHCIKYALKLRDDCRPEYDDYDSVLLDEIAAWTGDERFHKYARLWKHRADAGR
ncbi:hypothetical protein H8B02_30590 [Bradyrhizobium sp. Pear77]|uniref:D-glucuronyl C5-epimerase family protein n=1 Tax=Bradyrhizobium altum TaxID=1571202 RepID=UPI0028A28EEF|nr:D-glucuronyl C5-epimerase family protein [Bradyrhizobium altum]MCC8957623.1 hypothetical protein [Bradyrhizobium altum]